MTLPFRGQALRMAEPTGLSPDATLSSQEPHLPGSSASLMIKGAFMGLALITTSQEHSVPPGRTASWCHSLGTAWLRGGFGSGPSRAREAEPGS